MESPVCGVSPRNPMRMALAWFVVLVITILAACFLYDAQLELMLFENVITVRTHHG
jgi:hypothetical protein